MGNYAIVIQGTGCHHNFNTEGEERKVVGQHDADADKMARKFVQQLKEAGHSIEHASITHGGRDQIVNLQPHDR